MKCITLIIGLLVVGCGNSDEVDPYGTETYDPHKERDDTTEKPVKELTLEEKVIGEYKSAEGSTLVLRGDNVAEICDKSTARWSIVNNEVFLDKQGLLQTYYRIQLNGDLALVAVTILGNRNDLLTKDFTLYKKVRKD